MVTLAKNRHARRACLTGVLGLVALCAGVVLPTPANADSHGDFFRAVKTDNPDAVKVLLQRGLDPNLAEAERGDSGLILALREESMRVFRVLIAAPGIDLERAAFNGDTALMIAAYKSNKPAVEALLKKTPKSTAPAGPPCTTRPQAATMTLCNYCSTNPPTSTPNRQTKPRR